jgi:homoserine O-acetyltransferase
LTENVFESSDSVRGASTLAFAQYETFEGPVRLEHGGSLASVTVAYESYGTLSPRRDNVVLICHALSGDSHVARHDETDTPGWWDIAVGPGKIIDTNKYFVICPNILGGCRGTTGPNSINPFTQRPYGQDFPAITIGDMVAVQKLLLEKLGVHRLLAVIGGSMGGHQVLHWATKYPSMVAGAVALATSPRLTPQAIGFDVIGRNAILRDPNFRNGQYYDGGAIPSVGLALARMLGHITYLSPEAMKEKFEADRVQPRDVSTEFEKKFSVGSYLAYQGDKFVERFDANSYVTLTMAMDLFDLGGTPQQLQETLGRSECRWLVTSFTSDWLFPPEQSQEIVDALIARNKPVSYCNVQSTCGHDAFLLPNDLERYGELVRAFLDNLSGRAGSARVEESTSESASPTSIFHPRRLDYTRLLDLIPPSTRVLDLGCGRGALLAMLRQRGNPGSVGVELNEKSVIACVQRGLDVVQSDLDKGLRQFLDAQFDFVVLSQTLQAVRDVERVVSEMLRVGRRCIVSFPNFAYHKLRKMLWEQGLAPEAPGILRFKWYNTTNIRFLTIADFDIFCREKNIKVLQRITLDTEAGREVADDPNLNADLAIFVISR